MEYVREYIVTNWSTIIEYAVIVIAYFLFFLYRSKVSGTKRDLTVMFREKADKVMVTEAKLRRDMEDELIQAKISYKTATDEIYDLCARVKRLENTIQELITEEVIDDGMQDTVDEES
jgi:hypothetical protein